MTSNMKKYLIVIEETGSGYLAYSPDMPGCVSTGWTRTEVVHNIRTALAVQVKDMREEGECVPEPHTYSAYVELPA
jgi:predicted RNase H-like HicB family nuclease